MTYGFYVGGYGPQGISRMELQNGRMHTVGYTPCVNPSWITLSDDGKHLYAVGETQVYNGRSGGSVSSYDIKANGELVRTSERPTEGTDPCHALILDGLLLTANYSSGSLARFPIEADGCLGNALPLIQHKGHGPNPDRQEGPHVHQSALSPFGSVAVCDLGLDTVFFYDRASLHEAVPTVTEVRVPSGYGPRHCAFLPDSDVWYVACELVSRLLVFRGAPKEANLVLELPIGTGVPGNFPAALRFSSDRTMLLATGRGEDIIDIFGICPDNMPERRTELSSQGSWPRDAVFAPNGEHLLCADERASKLVLFNLGESEPIHTIDIDAPSCIVFDGRREI